MHLQHFSVGMPLHLSKLGGKRNIAMQALFTYVIISFHLPSDFVFEIHPYPSAGLGDNHFTPPASRVHCGRFR